MQVNYTLLFIFVKIEYISNVYLARMGIEFKKFFKPHRASPCKIMSLGLYGMIKKEIGS